MIADEIQPQKLPSNSPVLVMMPMADWQEGSWGGEFKEPGTPEQKLHIVGMLGPEFGVADGLPAFDAVAATLKQHGVDLKVYLQPSKRPTDAHIGCAICHGVEVMSWEQAKALPSFLPLIMFSGYHEPLPSSKES